MKLLLINPIQKEKWRNHLFSIYPPLNLAVIAAHTPPNWEVKIIDEVIQKVDLDEQVDLVGIGCLTLNAPRVYELAQKFREKGAKVVLGGIHPSMLPNEAKKYCDAVLIGEVESVWKEVINDFENKRLKKFYYGQSLPLVNLPLPRRDLLSKRYVLDSVETSRGCPMACKFCSVTKFNGGLLRQRPVKEVLNEMATIKKKRIFFTDSNIIGYGSKAEERAVELFRGLKEHNKSWVAQASINIADNDKILKYASESGCFLFFIGFESVNELALKDMGKKLNLKSGVENYKRTIRKIHDYGIMVQGALIFGNDADDKSIFKKTFDFVCESEMDMVSPWILTPLPGTEFYKELREQGRIINTNYPADWSRYMDCQATFKPKNMTLKELEEGKERFIDELLSTKLIFRRFIKSLSIARTPSSSLLPLAYHLTLKYLGYIQSLKDR